MSRILKHIVTGVAALSGAVALAQAPEGFSYYGDDDQGFKYHFHAANLESVKQNGMKGSVWIYVDHSADPAVPIASSTFRVLVDCSQEIFQITQSVSHLPGGSVSRQVGYNVDPQPVQPTPGTVSANLLKAICRRD